MALTAQQRALMTQQLLQAQGGSPQNTGGSLTPEQRAQMTAQLQAAAQPGSAAEEHEQRPNLLQSMARPFLRAGTNVLNVAEGIGQLSRGEFQNIDPKHARNFGPLGQNIRPVGVSDEGQMKNVGGFAKDVIGTGLEIGSYLAPAGEVANVGLKGASQAVKQTVARGVIPAFKTGAKLGSVAGGLGSLGSGLQREDATFGDIAKQTVIGAAAGGLIGGALPGGAAAGSQVAKGVRTATKTIKPAAGFIGRTVRNIGENLGEASTTAQRVSRLPAVEREAINSGIPEEVTKFISSASSGTKKGFKDMVKIAKGKSVDLRLRKQPKEVLGDAVLDRVVTVNKARKDVGKNLDAIVRRLPDKPVNITKTYEQLVDDLERKKIQVRAGGKLRSSGGVAPSDLRFYQKMVDRLRPNLSGEVLRTPQNIHETRQLLRNLFSESQRGLQPLSPEVRSFVENYRSTLANILPQEYRQAASQYARIMDVLDDFLTRIQYKGTMDEISTKGLKTGEFALRMLGNAADRPTSTIKAIEDLAKEFGYESLDSVDDLAQFADFLESVVGPPPRSLQGQLGKAGQEFVSDTLGGNVKGGIVKAISRAAGPTKERTIKALENLLK